MKTEGSIRIEDTAQLGDRWLSGKERLADDDSPLECPRKTSGPPTASAPCSVSSCRLHMASARARGGAAPVDSTECALTYASTEHSLEEVGQLLGCTREYVRQIEERALAKFHRALKVHRIPW